MRQRLSLPLRAAALLLLVSMLGIGLTSALTAPTVLPRAPGLANRHYDPLIRRAARRHLPPGWDWQLLKALVRQESNFRPHARSGVGAIGLCQIMPATAGDLDVPVDQLTDPATNLDAAARYLQWLWRQWGDARAGAPHYTRTRYVLASYNCGLTRTRDAWITAGRPQRWRELRPYLPEETQHYVDAIVDRHYPLYLAAGHSQRLTYDAWLQMQRPAPRH